MYTTQSGFSARSASPSSVATTPVSGRPARAPASWPTFAAPCAKTPTNSSLGSSRIARTAEAPTIPVVHWTTRTGAISYLPNDVEAPGRAHQCSHDGRRFGVGVETKARQLVEQGADQNLGLHLREVLTDAQVGAETEPHVALALARQIEGG